MTEESEKARALKTRIPNDTYRENYDKIFGKDKEKPVKKETK